MAPSILVRLVVLLNMEYIVVTLLTFQLMAPSMLVRPEAELNMDCMFVTLPVFQLMRASMFVMFFALADESEFILTFFDNGEFVDDLFFGYFDAIYGDGVAGDKLSGFAFTGSKAGGDEDVDEVLTFIGDREAFCE